MDYFTKWVEDEPLANIKDVKFVRIGDPSNTRGVPDWNLGVKVTSLVPRCPVARGPCLGSLGHLGHSLRLILFGRDTSALFHHILPLLLPFPLLIYKFELRVMRSRKIGVFSLTDHLVFLALCLRLHDL